MSMSLHPYNSLPAELVWNIVEEACHSNGLSDARELGLVCLLWQHIVTRTPHLWTDIVLFGRNSTNAIVQAKLWVARSYPLPIQVFMPNPCNSAEAEMEIQNHPHKWLAVHFHRISEIYIDNTIPLATLSVYKHVKRLGGVPKPTSKRGAGAACSWTELLDLEEEWNMENVMSYITKSVDFCADRRYQPHVCKGLEMLREIMEVSLCLNVVGVYDWGTIPSMYVTVYGTGDWIRGVAKGLLM